MEMDACISNGKDATDCIYACNLLANGYEVSENGITEPQMLMEILAFLNVELAYFSEKLVNLDLYMTTVSLGEIGLGSLSMTQRNISEEEIEKALIFDLSFGFLDSEISELGSGLEALRAKLVDASQKIYSFKPNNELYPIFQGKLQASENSWKHLQEQLSDLKRQLTAFHKTLSLFHDKFAYSTEKGVERSHYDFQISGQQKLVLNMLEKSLASELDLEKQLLESKRREEDLKLKLSLTNDVISGMEVFLEDALERLLEADHSSQVFKGIAKEMMSRLQICEFNMHCSVRREEELKLNLERSLAQLKEKINVECTLKELREKLVHTETKLQEVKTSYEASQEELSAMEETNESLQEHILIAEKRAHDAEEKLATLTEENAVLREELGFLKNGDGNEEKLSLLEKQVRDLEVKLQTSKLSAEASQEQQNMLYTAIWDMETLIEELKSKSAKAESRVEVADKQCLDLAETNLELNKEVGFLKSENLKLVDNLKEAKKMQVEKAKEINDGAKLFTEMAVQLALERDRVQKQLSSLARENKILLGELQKVRKNILGANKSNKEADKKDSDCIIDNPMPRINTTPSQMEDLVDTPKSTAASNQVDEPLEENDIDDREATGSVSSDTRECTISEAEAAESSRTAPVDVTKLKNVANYGNHDNNAGTMRIKIYIIATVLVLVASMLAMNISWEDMYPVIRRLRNDFQ